VTGPSPRHVRFPIHSGPLLDPELDELGRLLTDPRPPYVVVCGGAKVADKLCLLQQFGSRADAVLIGGRMADQLRVSNPFAFPVELPVDVVGATRLDDTDSRVFAIDELPYGWVGLDIGPSTRTRYAEALADARTILWHGPMGAFDWPRCSEGAIAVAEAVAHADAYSVVGGADALQALDAVVLAHRAL
jgi:phosphoglycerate kinase